MEIIFHQEGEVHSQSKSQITPSGQITLIENTIRKQDGLQIEITWQDGLSNSNKQIFQTAAQMIVDLFSTNILHRVTVSDMDQGLGQSETALVTFNSYTTFRNFYEQAIHSNATRSTVMSDNMPNVDPLIGPHTYFTTVSQALAWKIDITNVQSNISIHFSQTQYDLVGVCLHELTETMGRMGGFTQDGTTYRSLVDLCNFNGNHSRSVPYGSGSYFSIDTGVSVVSYFNTNMDGDAMDWSGVTLSNDCCNAFANADTQELLSVQDLFVMESVAYDLAPIQYGTDNKLLLVVGEQSTVTNTYHSILAISNFDTTPVFDLDGLTFDSAHGAITGTPTSVMNDRVFEVKLASEWIQKRGEFQVTVQNKTNGGLSTGAIVGIVLGSVAFVAIVITLSVVLSKKKK